MLQTREINSFIPISVSREKHHRHTHAHKNMDQQHSKRENRMEEQIRTSTLIRSLYSELILLLISGGSRLMGRRNVGRGFP